MRSTDEGSELTVANSRLRGNLPARLTRFFGRESEVTRLRALLADRRLVTLVGAGGCGKTRLALETAARLSGEHRDGAWLVDLGSVADADLVHDSVARVLDIRELSGGSVSDGLTSALTSRELLIVLDNCEHVLEATAVLTDRLLQRCPSLRILATSRRPLDCTGEQTVVVPPLPIDAAAALFADRARLASGAAPAERDAEVVERICARLDGLPLAVELAAARMRSLTPREILERLEDAMELLNRGRSTTRPHHRTLRAMVDWSYGLLEGEQQALFDHLSVFAGGFDMEAAEAVAGYPVLDTLTALVDQSLVIAEANEDGTTRYRLLEVIRQYAWAHLAARGEVVAVRLRHAKHYLGLARRGGSWLRGGEWSRWLPGLRRDHGNFRRALETLQDRTDGTCLALATALGPYWDLNGSIAEGLAWMERGLEGGGGDAALRATALLRASRLAWLSLDYDRAQRYLTESLEIKRETGDRAGVARRLMALVTVALGRGDADAVRRLTEDALEIQRELGDRRGMGWTHLYRAFAAYQAADRRAAIACYQEALVVLRELDEPVGTAFALGGLGTVHAELGRVAKGREEITEALQLVRNRLGGIAGEPGWVWICLVWLCLGLAWAEGRRHSVVRLYGAVEAMFVKGLVGPFSMLTRNQGGIEQVRLQLGRATADRLAAEGAAMTIGELIAETLSTEPDPDQPLSARELEVAELLTDGLTGGAIAERLSISVRTVESHIDHIKNKLGLATRPQIAAWVVEHRTAG